jgi:hypothetical protein
MIFPFEKGFPAAVVRGEQNSYIATEIKLENGGKER